MTAAAEDARRDSLHRHARAFHARFGNGPGVRLFFSPGRVNLMGAHLDYNGGPVMPMAIDRGTFIAVRPRAGRMIRLASTLEEGELEADLGTLPPRASGAWHDYPVGVLSHLLGDAHDACGLDVLFGGDLPIGAGLSSSASICVGTATVADRLWGLSGSRQRCVEAALFGEREFVGVRCGIMDPYAVGFARPDHLLWLDCKDRSTRHLPLDTAETAIAVADSGVRRELAQGAFNERVAECAAALAILREHEPGIATLRDAPKDLIEDLSGALGPRLLRRARHVASEVERTFAARDALLQRELAGFGARMTEAHRSLRDLYDVSTPELDSLVDAALEVDGVLGSRLTGAGFGGCTVVLLLREAVDELAPRIQASFRRRFGREPDVAIYAGDGGPREIV